VDNWVIFVVEETYQKDFCGKPCGKPCGKVKVCQSDNKCLVVTGTMEFD